MPTIVLPGAPGGRRYAYQDRGDGPALVLLHGFPLSSDCFRPQLEAPPSGVRLIAPDHRGFGSSELPVRGETTTMDDMADDAWTLLDQLGIARAFIGGLSMGGYVAMAMLRRAPTRVRGLFLLDTQASADDAAAVAKRHATAADVLAQGPDVLANAMMPKMFAATTGPGPRALVDCMMRDQAPEAIARAARGMAARPDAHADLAAFTGPAMIVVGRDDVVTPIAKAQAMRQAMPQSVLHVLDDAGHLAQLEQPTAVADLMRALVTT